jgi:sterol desaturase/sphingolipid hydroxylase (fatty acid hydroxylase superfamily)
VAPFRFADAPQGTPPFERGERQKHGADDDGRQHAPPGRAVHHVDRDLDASTALRFHAGELALSIPWRAMQIAAIGVPPTALRLWQNLVLISILFHHSNVELPIAVERLVARFVVTPRLHGIHHSSVPEEMDSNWSSGLTVWDCLHGTLRVDVPQQAITIGVAAYPALADVTLGNSFALPFIAQRPTP